MNNKHLSWYKEINNNFIIASRAYFLHVGLVQFAPLTIFFGGGRKEERGGKEGGGRVPPLPSLFPSFLPPMVRPIWGRTSPWWLVRFPSWPIRPISFVGGARNPFRWSDKYPVTPETLPVSEYHRPIYKSLPLDHLETPLIRDLIRDSEQHSLTKPHNSYNNISSSNVKCANPTGSRTM